MGAQNRRPYTSIDDSFIARHYGDWSNRSIAYALGRTESGVRYRAKKLGLVHDRQKPPMPKDSDSETKSRLSRLFELLAIMDWEIENDNIPMMHKPAYFREYRGLLAEISDITGASWPTSTARA